MRRCRLLTLFLTSLATFACAAAEVTAEDAAKAVGNWRVRKGQLGLSLGRTVRDSRRAEFEGAKFNIVRMEGGGVVITPTDTAIRPVILFMEGDDFEVCAENPAVALLTDELGGEPAQSAAPTLMSLAAPSENEREWSALLSDRVLMAASRVDDVRVEPLVKSGWNQKEDESGKYCYNYYTPDHVYCGCVATSTAQVMRYFEYPAGEVEVFTGKYTKVYNDTIPMTAQGGVYDWSKMPYEPGKGTTDEERRMIGKLTSDVGIAMAMQYAANGSGSFSYMPQYALCKRYGYSHVAAAFSGGGPTSAIDDAFGNALRANLDAKLPVILNVPGHSIIGDGYGYIGKTLYYHLNLGWGSGYSAWYAPPNDLTRVNEKFRGFDAACYNIYTTRDPSLVIASGRVTDETGRPAAGIRVAALNADASEADATETDAHGIYALFVKPGAYKVSAYGEILREGRLVATRSGETTAAPTKCITVTANATGSYSFSSGKPRNVSGNASGCDIALERVDLAPAGTIVFDSDFEIGTNFATVKTHVTATVGNYGVNESPATVEVELWDGVKRLGSRSFGLSGTYEPKAFEVNFDGLQAGTAYRMVARLKVENETLSEAATSFIAAREKVWISEANPFPPWQTWEDDAAVFAPSQTVASVREVVVDARFEGFAEFDELPVPDGRASVAAVWTGACLAELVVWNGAAWTRTGETLAEDEECRVSIALDEIARRVIYRVRRGGEDWTDLGTGTLAAAGTVSAIAVRGATDVLAITGTATDDNLIGAADGAEYADLAAAFAAEAANPLRPLWPMTGTLPAKLGTFQIADPNGWLSFLGGDGRVLRTETGADGVTKVWYGQATDEQIASGRYLDVSCELGLEKLLTDETPIEIEDFGGIGSDGSLTFKVRIDGKENASAYLANLVEECSELKNAQWENPKADRVTVRDGTVHVRPQGDSCFLRVAIPENPVSDYDTRLK